MPPNDVFLKAISFDHFDHRALCGHTPNQFRYDWCTPPPPLPESLVAYNRHNNRSSISFVHDLMSIPVALSSIDRVRTKTRGASGNKVYGRTGVGLDVRVLENVSDRNYIP